MQSTGAPQGRSDVERTLETIRRLMERGQQYEAITARGALLAGLLALAASGALWWTAPGDDVAFLVTWLCVAALSASWVFGTALRHARRSGRSWVSAQARSVAREVLPAYAAAGVLTAVLAFSRPELLPATWMLLHGTAILATAHHAPPRIVALGAAFLVAGTVFAFVPAPRELAMAIAFGGLNLVHAALGFLRPVRD